MVLTFLFLLLPFFPTQTDSVVKWLGPTEHDFDYIPQGKPVHVGFRFKNTSGAPMTIDNVRSSCGCTAPEWDESVIPPGEERSINIEYDAFKEGYFRKKITVFFSTQKKAEKLYIMGYVEST